MARKDKDKHRAYMKAWREENKVHLKEYLASYYQNNKDKWEIVDKAAKAARMKEWASRTKDERERVRREWILSKPDHYRAYRLKRDYNLSLEEFSERSAACGGLCEICRGDNRGKVLYVDHNHDTGKVRGLLCRECNIAISLLKEDGDVLLSAMIYLQRAADG